MSHLLTFIFHPTFLCLGPEELHLVIVICKQFGNGWRGCTLSCRAEQTRARNRCHIFFLAETHLGLPFLVSLKIQRRKTEPSFLQCKLFVHLFTQQPPIEPRPGGTTDCSLSSENPSLWPLETDQDQAGGTSLGRAVP